MMDLEVDISPRLQMAHRVFDHCADAGIIPEDTAFHIAHDSKKRKHYRFKIPVTSYHPDTIVIRVYGERSIMLVSETPFSNPSYHSMIFRSEDDLLRFLDAAFVHKDPERITQALQHAN